MSPETNDAIVVFLETVLTTFRPGYLERPEQIRTDLLRELERWLFDESEDYYKKSVEFKDATLMEIKDSPLVEIVKVMDRAGHNPFSPSQSLTGGEFIRLDE